MRARPVQIEHAFGLDWLSLVEAKAFLRVSFSEDDDMIQSMLDASATHARAVLGRPIVAESRTVQWGPLTSEPSELILPHVDQGASVTSLTVSVAGAAPVPQSYRLASYDPDLGEIAVELEGAAGVSSDAPGIWTALVDVPEREDLRPLVRQARLIMARALYDGAGVEQAEAAFGAMLGVVGRS